MIAEGAYAGGPGRAVSKDGATLFAEMNRLLGLELASRPYSEATVERATRVVMRVMRPYLRNRFSIQDTTTPHDRRLSRLRITLLDHAERRVATPDDLVIAFQDLQPCQ